MTYDPTDELLAAKCVWESHFDPNAEGSAQERGIYQLHPVHRAWIPEWDRMFEPEYNTEMAIRLWRQQGWTPWTTRWKCGL